MAGRRPPKTTKPLLTMHDWEAKHYVVGGRDHPRRDGDVRLQLVVLQNHLPRLPDSLGARKKPPEGGLFRTCIGP